MKLDNSIYKKIEIKDSKIHGKGVFAKENIPKNIFYLDSILVKNSFFGGKIIRYINHSYNPNIETIKIGNKLYGKTIKNIKKGDELTSNYDLDVNTFNYNEMLKFDYNDILDVKKVKTNIPFIIYKITPKT